MERGIYDCIVIGGGPGGIIAALYLQRLNRKTVLVSSGPPRAERIPKIRNLAGYAQGISGKTLLRRLHRQLAKYGGEIIDGRAQVEKRGRGFIVNVEGRRLKARKVILATGMRDIEPELTERQRLTQEGLLGYCPICDGFDHSGEKIALLVQSNLGAKKVGFMSAFTKDLVLVMVRPFALTETVQADLGRRGIPVLRGLKGARRTPKGLLLIPARGRPVEVNAAYVMLGTKVPTDAVRGISGLTRSPGGFLKVNDHQETSVPGLFAVGDCVSGLSQVSVAVGQAAVAATHVHNTL